MGIFDFLKKKPTSPQSHVVPEYIKQFEIPFELAYLSDGLQMIYHNEEYNPNQLYDTTKLILYTLRPIFVNDTDGVSHTLFHGKVSYYNGTDAARLHEDGSCLIESSVDYRDIVIEGFDLEKLKTDFQYAHAFFTQFLDENRVEKYIQYGLQDDPEYPCGIYIGGISPKNGKYFSRDIGYYCHHSPYMQKKRASLKSQKAASLSKEISAKEAEIRELKRSRDQINNVTCLDEHP